MARKRMTSTEIGILSIDAWRDGDGWTWNNWTKIGTCDVCICDLPPEDLVKWLYDEDYLATKNMSKLSIDDDQYNLVVCDKKTGEPLIALAYGEIQ